MEEVDPLVTGDSGEVSLKDKVTVLIAMDGSEFSDYALQCRYNFHEL